MNRREFSIGLAVGVVAAPVGLSAAQASPYAAGDLVCLVQKLGAGPDFKLITKKWITYEPYNGNCPYVVHYSPFGTEDVADIWMAYPTEEAARRKLEMLPI